MKKMLYNTSLVVLPSIFKREIYGGNIMLYRISVVERGITGIANIFRSRLSGLDDLLRAGTVPLTRAPLGYFYNAPHWGGGFSSSNLRNYWTDSKNSSGI